MTNGSTTLPPGAAGWPPDPIAAAQYYESVTLRRVCAYVLDAMIIAMIVLVLHLALTVVTIMTFGLFAPLQFLVIPLALALAYHILQIASPVAATVGMRLFGLRAWSVVGGRPTGTQAIIHGFCFYGSMSVTGGLVALVALFNSRRQTLHDMLAGIVVLREI